MAKMYPVNIEDYNYTESEKFFYKLLRTKLSDTFSVFYSVKWFTLVNGEKSHSECDFLIFHPSYGYITVEVKGGVRLQKSENEWRIWDTSSEEEYRVLRRSPFKQAEESMYYFKSYFEEQNGYFYRGVFGFAVALPFYSVEEDFGPEGPRFLILDYSDLEHIEENILRIFKYWRGKAHNFISFSADQQEKFIKMVNKRVALSAAAGSLIEIRGRQLEGLNRVQNNYIELLCNLPQVFIVGGAGTGKTWIGVRKAKYEAGKGKKVLYICYNKPLKEFVQALVEPETIVVHSFYSLVVSLLGESEYRRLFANSRELMGVSGRLKTANSLLKYDCIIVDEAQDFSEEWASCIRMLLRSQRDSSLYVFYDENQNIFHRSFGSGFKISIPPLLLTENIRNTAGIYRWAVKETNLGRQVRPNTLEGVEPEKIVVKDSKQAKRKLEELLNTLTIKEQVSNESIVVLSNRTIENSILKGERELAHFKFVTENTRLSEEQIAFRTVQGFKGLEADVVIYLNHREYDEDPNQVYVAYTRARFYLYVIEIDSP